MNRSLLESLETPPTAAMVVRVEAAERDERWRFVQSQRPQRWLWHAIDHQTGDVLADVLAPHEDQALEALMDRLTPCGIQPFDTDAWGAYWRLLEPEQHTVGKAHTQRIERQHLTLRTRIKRLARKTIGFSKSVLMHDTVISLFINRDEFGRGICPPSTGLEHDRLNLSIPLRDVLEIKVPPPNLEMPHQLTYPF